MTAEVKPACKDGYRGAELRWRDDGPGSCKVRTTAVILAAVLLVGGIRAGSAAPVQSWVTRPKAPCQGLTVGWMPTLSALQQVVGPRWNPAPGPVKGHGLLLLFATACPHSLIGKQASGAFTMGAVIVPVQTPAHTHGIHVSNGHGWAVVPDVLGNTASPVMQLFGSHGFAVTNARVTLTIRHTAKGNRARMRFITPLGQMNVSALVTGPVQAYSNVSALAGIDPAMFSLFTGLESASRQAQGSAEVTAKGDTWVSRLHLDAHPKIVTLDQNFVWAFEFSEQPYSRSSR